jgi:hypothetical protein
LRSGAILAYAMERGCVRCVQRERRFRLEMYYTVSVRCWTWRRTKGKARKIGNKKRRNADERRE